MKIKTEVVIDNSVDGNPSAFKVTSKGLNAHKLKSYGLLGYHSHTRALANKFGFKLKRGDKYLFNITNRIPSSDFISVVLERDACDDFVITSPSSLVGWEFCEDYFTKVLKKIGASLKKDTLTLYLKMKKI